MTNDVEKKLIDTKSKYELSLQSVQEKSQEIITLNKTVSKQVRQYSKYHRGLCFMPVKKISTSHISDKTIYYVFKG